MPKERDSAGRSPRSAIVRINDRGPFVRGARLISAVVPLRQIGMGSTADVHIEVYDRKSELSGPQWKANDFTLILPTKRDLHMAQLVGFLHSA
jgi:rare lipoprotein A (peptidoglycan hydrolase)